MDFQSEFVQIGSVQIRYYGIIIVTALLAATFVAVRLAKRTKRDPEHVYGALTWAIIPGIIFARLWFVFFPPAATVNTFVTEEYTYNVAVSEVYQPDLSLASALDDTMTITELPQGFPDVGLQSGDVVTAFQLLDAEEPVAVGSPTALELNLFDLAPDTEVQLFIEREGEVIDPVTLRVDQIFNMAGATDVLVNTLNPAMLFETLPEDSRLAEIGFKPDDRVVSIQLPGQDEPIRVASLTALEANVQSLNPDDTVKITVSREVRTDRNWFLRNFFDLDNGAIAIWSGGLSIFGALLGGGLGAYLYLWKNGLSIGPWLDIAAVVIPLGQAIGRFANYVNQELFGKLTDLPWALHIPQATAETVIRASEGIPPGQPIVGDYSKYIVTNNVGDVFYTVHPLWAYEAIWSLIAFGVLLWLFNNRRNMFRPFDFLLMYVVQYSAIRFLLEFIRFEVTLVNGVNVSQVVTGVAFVVAGTLLLIRLATRKRDPRTYDEIAPSELLTKSSQDDTEENGKRKRRKAV
ncbi:MAG: hypothetical protein CUN56_01840 [Phototrophicales bacterium]|nr:MAG: hypothetical protein CUN56_01840 [Phototrophicales bacterium]